MQALVENSESFSVAKATLQSQMSVRLSVRLSVSHKNPSASQNHAYQPNLSLLAIMPISHNATMPFLSLSES